MNQKKLHPHIAYWKISAERDWKTAQTLFDNKRYDACLFFSHLSLEKLLKGFVVAQTGEPAPHIHNLPRLGRLGGLTFSPQQEEELKELTSFHIAGRYDIEKFAFYKRCTPSFTKKWFAKSYEWFLWLKERYPKK